MVEVYVVEKFESVLLLELKLVVDVVKVKVPVDVLKLQAILRILEAEVVVVTELSVEDIETVEVQVNVSVDVQVDEL
jgi:hypothetical protein